MTSKALVVFSGGQDSTTCLYWALEHYDEVQALTFAYGQRHAREVIAADEIVKFVQRTRPLKHETVMVGPILAGTSPLTDHNRGLEQYADHASMEKIIGDRIEHTFVPMRNALFLVLAANRAVCAGIDNIVTGVCQSDNANYPDCTQAFIDKQTAAINEALGRTGIVIQTPLMNKTKAQSIDMALRLPGCYVALGYSHTAYDGAYPPTGRDHATVLRAHGFEEAGVPDPLIVRAYWQGLLSELPDTENYRRFQEVLPRSSGFVIEHEESTRARLSHIADVCGRLS